ncbi:hypothetical protein niasHT_027005 [Heterodera trifolii]|uniref:Uncharacterized protein n=1 Tax=Heterodera trifolii TaxID=157864 RepID=A0ABD2JIR0_9BILA
MFANGSVEGGGRPGNHQQQSNPSQQNSSIQWRGWLYPLLLLLLLMLPCSAKSPSPTIPSNRLGPSGGDKAAWPTDDRPIDDGRPKGGGEEEKLGLR